MVRGTPSKRRASGAARHAKRTGEPAAGAPKKRRGRPPLRRDPELDDSDPSRYVIRRYGNRRLYDTRRKRAITATEVAELIRKGETIVVQDGDSGDDVTNRFLVQLILEEHNTPQLELLPAEMLRLIIGAPKAPYTLWLKQYMAAGADWLQREARQLSQHFAGPSAMDAMWKAWNKSAPWDAFTGEFVESKTASAPPPAKPAREARRKNAEEELRDEMAELQRRLADLASKMPRR